MEYKKQYNKVYKKSIKAEEKAPAYKPKRGKLVPLMKEDAKANASIHELSYDFGCRMTRLFQYLTEDSEYKEYIISKQIYRSVTSIGANVRESKHALGWTHKVEIEEGVQKLFEWYKDSLS